MAKALDPILRWKEVQRQTGVSRTTAWRKIREGKFPAPDAKPTDDTVGWFQSTIARYQEERRAITAAVKKSEHA